MIEAFILLGVVLFALGTVVSNSLRRSIIYMGGFSLMMILSYLFYRAPDVAFAETTIGLGLTSLLYLVALRRVKIYSICYVDNTIETFSDKNIHEISSIFLNELELFLEKEEEMESQFSYSTRPLAKLLDQPEHDLIIYKEKDTLYLYGNSSDAIFSDIVHFANIIVKNDYEIKAIFKDTEDLYEPN
ncbi:Na(+)/H(+) antiporter subunit B [Lacticigenium naphthae]|uniref:Na(+)/H(+) antiporter subunit B n=1 Tax=Lacticigenium naphthae TaxID=515351 RepID=UPI0003FF8FFD|nr:hydrogenase subunit MbhD domain-containing protein [Lacticigenium naphthae]